MNKPKKRKVYLLGLWRSDTRYFFLDYTSRRMYTTDGEIWNVGGRYLQIAIDTLPNDVRTNIIKSANDLGFEVTSEELPPREISLK